MCRCRWRELKQQFDLKSHDAKLLSDSLKKSTHGQQLEDVNQLEATIGLRFLPCITASTTSSF